MDVSVLIPVLDDRILKNAIGSDQNEVDVNLSFIELTDEEEKRIEFKTGTVVFD